MRDIVIGCDSGTQAVKALAMSLDGIEIARAEEAHLPPRFTPDGGAEQNAEQLARALFRVLQRVAHRVGKKRVAALAITTQRDGLLPFRNKHPARPLFLWMDRRRHLGPNDTVPKRYRDEPYATLYRTSRVRWLRSQEKETHLHTTRWGTLGAYFHELLCNRFAESAAALPLLLPVDRWRPAWSSDRAAWRAVGLDPTAVPEAIPAGSLVGPLSGSGAKRTGLSPGVPVVATGGDKNCEILGGAARGPVEGVLSLGTALSLGTMVDDLDVYRRNPSLWCTAAPTADRWTVEAGVPGGLWTLEWLAGLLSSSLKRLERIAQCVPPGSEGVTLVPHFSGSVSQPGARGVVSGLTPQHGPGHLYRAALEGLAFEARRCREEIETTSGCVMNTIRLAGGGSRSPLFRGILAAVVGRKLLVPKQPAGGARGAAVMASLLIRPGRLEARVRKFMGDYERVSSSSALRRTYESLYESQYLEVRPTSTIHLDSA